MSVEEKLDRLLKLQAMNYASGMLVTDQVLFYYKRGFSREEIADMLDTTIAVVDVRLSELRKRRRIDRWKKMKTRKKK